MRIFNYLPVFPLIFAASCTSVEIKNFKDESSGNYIMTSHRDSLFSSPRKKLELILSVKDGVQIKKINWEGRSIITDSKEQYPNPEHNLLNLNPRILNDNKNLILVDSIVREEFKLSRSFKMKYKEDTDEYQLEVLYHVKNLSSEKTLTQQWVNEFTVNTGSYIFMSAEHYEKEGTEKKLTVIMDNIKDLQIMRKDKNTYIMANKEAFKLGTKERLSWKVIYSLID